MTYGVMIIPKAQRLREISKRFKAGGRHTEYYASMECGALNDFTHAKAVSTTMQKKLTIEDFVQEQQDLIDEQVLVIMRLLKAVGQAHRGIDILMAQLITAKAKNGETFSPTKSKVWPIVKELHHIIYGDKNDK